MCTLFHTNSAGLSKLGHILKNPKKYFYEHIFFPPVFDTERFLIQSYQLNKVHIVQCTLGCPTKTCFFKIKKNQPTPVVFGW